MRKSTGLSIRSKIILTIFAVVLTAASSGFAAPWSFVVAGDDRTDPHNPAMPPDPTGINTHIFTNLLQAIAVDPSHPLFMLFTGDLVLGTNAHFPVPIADQFKAWQGLVQAGLPTLPVLPVRGNHETYGDPDGALWKTMFKPGLDENHVTWFPGEEGYSYYYAVPGHPEAAVIGVDQFIQEHRVNLEELKDALESARTNGVRRVFVFAHEMAFTCTSHPDTDNMAAFPEARDRFVELLKRYNCQYFFAGHDHAYDWMEIRHETWPANYVLNQIVAGTAGAPFYPDRGYFGDHHGYNLVRRDHKQKMNGYLRVTVDDDSEQNKVRVAFVPVSVPR
jgi:hypothetical protein